MKKSRIIFLLIFSLNLLLLNSCNNTNNIEKNIKNTNNIKIKKKNKKEKQTQKQIFREKSISLAMENTAGIEKLRKNIDLKDIIERKNSSNNKLLDMGLIFLKELDKQKTIENLNKQIEKLPKNIVANYEIDLNFYDSTTAFKEKKQRVNNVELFINGIKIAETNSGKIKTTINWPKGIEVFKIVAKSPSYGDSILLLNKNSSPYNSISRNIFFKKLDTLLVDIKKEENTTIKYKNQKLVFKPCSFIDKTGKCFFGKAKIKIEDYDEIQLNNTSSPFTRKGIVDGKITYIYPKGALFLNISDLNGNNLKLKENIKFNIEYSLAKDKIETLDLEKLKEKKYFYFDKKDSLWKTANIKFSIDKQKNILNIETSKIIKL